MARPKEILLLVETSRVFGRGVIQGVSRYANERANWIFHFEDRGLLERVPRWLKGWSGDGIIARSPSVALSREIERLGRPVVELLGDGERLSAEVRTDEAKTAALAVDHLLKQGYEHVAYYSFANSWWSDARRDAFQRLVRSRGLSGFVFSGAFEGEGAPYPVWRRSYEAPLLRWLDQLPKPVGVWAATDAQAVRVLEACRKTKLLMPSEAGVLGTSNDEMVCGLLTPPLSSIELNPREVGYRAAMLLDRKLRNRRKASTRRRPPQLVAPSRVIPRASTDRLAVIDPELDEAMKIIEREAVNGLTVARLVDEMLLSRSTLERRFRKHFNASPEQEINRVRIERAKAFLRETAWPIRVVGEKSGFASPENFIRFFRRHVGKTPRQYRNELYADAD